MADMSELLTTADVARLTRSPLSTVRYWRHCGHGPKSFRLGRRVVYRREDVEQWISRCESGDQRNARGA
jgi:predicted DNA-binding transcriptional regulator AlpA